MLFNCTQGCMITYLLSHIDQIPEWNELLQMVVLDSVRKVCRSNRREKEEVYQDRCLSFCERDHRDLRVSIITRLLDIFYQIRAASVRSLLFGLLGSIVSLRGEYCLPSWRVVSRLLSSASGISPSTRLKQKTRRMKRSSHHRLKWTNRGLVLCSSWCLCCN